MDRMDGLQSAKADGPGAACSKILLPLYQTGFKTQVFFVSGRNASARGRKGEDEVI